MTFQLLSTFTGDFSQQSLTAPTISINGRGRICYRLRALPPADGIIYGYFVVGNLLNDDDGAYESPERYKWYPNEVARLFLFEVLRIQNSGVANQLKLFPIEQFRTKAVPQNFSIEVSYFDSLI